MEPHPIIPEYLHKDELSYELEVRGISTEGLNVSDLRSIFRKSRDVKENPTACTSSEIFRAPDNVLIFCHQRFQLIKDLVENTVSSSVIIDFPRCFQTYSTVPEPAAVLCLSPQPQSLPPTLLTAARQSFPGCTVVTCKIRIDRYTWIFPFYIVENLPCPVILGSDFELDWLSHGYF
jgi:hypothetical protein